MSQLLSSPSSAVNSKIFIYHRLKDTRFLNAGVFSGKRDGFAVKPAARVKLSVKSRQENKQRFGDSSSSPSYSPQNGKPLKSLVSNLGNVGKWKREMPKEKKRVLILKNQGSFAT